VVFSADRELMLEFSRDIWTGLAHSARVRRKWPEPRRLAGVTAVLTTPEARGNFWHWTTELLPRLHLLEQAGWPLDRIDRFLVNDSVTSYRQLSLKELGIPLEKVMEVTGNDDLALEVALVPTLRDTHYDLPIWAAQFLSERQPRSRWGGSRRLYLTRRSCQFRGLLNENELMPELEARGFELFEPEKHPLSVQRGAFAAAEIVLGVHGSAFTHAYLCKPGTRVIELMPPSYIDLCFWCAAQIADARYGVLLGCGSRPKSGENIRGRFDDLVVDPREFREMIEAVAPQAR
jgi:capsular polysaccharide biosynthesis protein